MEFITGVLLALAAVVAGIYYFRPKNKLQSIPGPKGYPLVGNALDLGATQPHETVRKWAKEYGDVMKINLFGDDIVVANSYESIMEVLLTKSNDYAGRIYNYRCHTLFKDGFLFQDMNPSWSYMKKACMTGLKQVGDHIAELEDILQGFLDDTVESFMKQTGKAVNVRDDIYAFVCNVTFTLLYGSELPACERNQVCEITNKISAVFNPVGDNASLDTLPFLRFPWYGKYRELMKVVTEAREFYRRQLNDTIAQHNNEIRCVLDILIKEDKNPSIEDIPRITFANINTAGIDMGVAGVNTTSSVLYYVILVMAAKPDLQEEAYQHIIKVIGHRPPSLNDRFSIPFIEAMILEQLRFMSHVPFSVPHKSLKDTTLNGYEIPAGTQVWVNLWHLHHDEQFWEDPWEFKPTRFLDDDGNLLTADHPLRKHFCAFGAGRRVCVGENLAKYRIFLFLVAILQKFQFVAPEGEKYAIDPRELEDGYVLRPRDYKVKIELRQ